jgi:hypothetical protein
MVLPTLSFSFDFFLNQKVATNPKRLIMMPIVRRIPSSVMVAHPSNYNTFAVSMTFHVSSMHTVQNKRSHTYQRICLEDAWRKELAQGVSGFYMFPVIFHQVWM